MVNLQKSQEVVNVVNPTDDPESQAPSIANPEVQDGIPSSLGAHRH